MGMGADVLGGHIVGRWWERKGRKKKKTRRRTVKKVRRRGARNTKDCRPANADIAADEKRARKRRKEQGSEILRISEQHRPLPRHVLFTERAKGGDNLPYTTFLRIRAADRIATTGQNSLLLMYPL